MTKRNSENNIHIDNNIVEIFDGIIRSALQERASDIHIDPTQDTLSVSFRVNGKYIPWQEYPIDIHESMMLRIKVLTRFKLDDKFNPKDGKFSWVDPKIDSELRAEIRVSMMPTSHGENAVLRIFDPLISVMSLEELGISDVHTESLREALAFRSGLIAIIGPTGSGKTTTLYSILNYIKKFGRLIISIEDPVERNIEGVRQIEVGGNTQIEYVTVLKSILRQDPDVLMIGEVRDKESAQLAIQCALTGHLVITTLHASSVDGVRKRLTNMGIKEYLIDAVLLFVMSQRLVTKMCPLNKKVVGRRVMSEILSFTRKYSYV